MITEFPLLAFTALTGIAAGAYVGAAAFPCKGDDARAWVFPLVALVLTAVGGLSAIPHLGRPAMMLNVLNNPTASITMEGMSAGALAVVAIVDLVLAKRSGAANRAMRIVGAVVGVICMCIVTSAYVTSYGNPAWIAAPTWPLFFAGDLACGLACWALFAGDDAKSLSIATAVVNAVFACVLAWQASVFGSLGEAGATLIGAGAACAAIAAIVAAVATAGKVSARTAAIAVLAIAFIALFASRYGFYMASII